MDKFDDYSAAFFWNYKRMDNVNYNFQIVEVLVSSFRNAPDEEKEFFCKPITLILISIIECSIADFLMRVQEHRSEKIKNFKMTPQEIKKIQSQKLPNALFCYAQILRKYALLGKDSELYGSLERASVVRNRIHIQNLKGKKPHDERFLWNETMIKKAGNLLREIYIFLRMEHPRKPLKDCDYEMLRQGFPAVWENL